LAYNGTGIAKIFLQSAAGSCAGVASSASTYHSRHVESQDRVVVVAEELL